MLPPAYDETVRVELNKRSDLIADVHQAVAVVQIIGSSAAANRAVALASHLGQVPPTAADNHPEQDFVTEVGVIFLRGPIHPDGPD